MHSPVADCPDHVRRTLLGMAASVPLLAMAGATSAGPAATIHSTGLPADLARAIDAYDRATVSNDVATLGELVAEDYLLVNSDSSVQGKQSYLDDFKLPGFKVDPYVVQQPVLKLWGDTALMGGLLHLSWIQDGERHRRMLRVAHVWVRQDGRWQMQYTQLTRVPE